MRYYTPCVLTITLNRRYAFYFYSQMQPSMLLKLLRKLTVDVSKLSEYTTVALRVSSMYQCVLWYRSLSVLNLAFSEPSECWRGGWRCEALFHSQTGYTNDSSTEMASFISESSKLANNPAAVAASIYFKFIF